MKHYLFFGVAAFALFSMSAQSQAQNYNQSYSKGDARIINDARRIQSEPDRQAQVAPQPQQPRADQVANIEPAAGDGRDFYEDFTGVYGGGSVGYNMGNYDIDDPAGPDGEIDLDDWNGGFFIGYGFNHNFNWLGAYAGIEAAYEWDNAEDSFGGNSYGKNHAWLITLRPGISLYENTLGYGIIGYSRGEFEGGGDEEELDGFVLGLGAQMNTHTVLKPRLEYTYTNYEDTDLGSVSFDGHENNIKLGAVLQF